MSSGLPYLKSLKKTELTELAETSNLQGYGQLKKADLETALDDHLQNNSTRLASEPSLSTYFSRAGASHRSPVKKIAEKVSEMVKSDDEASAPAKKARRKTTTAQDSGDSTALMKTPAVKEVQRRSSILASPNINAPSPKVVADAVELRARQFSQSVSRAFDRTHLNEYADIARDLMSTPSAVLALALILEGYGLRENILPFKKFVDLPPVPYARSSKTPVLLPDVFLFLDQAFWAPFTLWLLTSVILPGTVAYFINLPLKAHPSHSYATRKATTQANTSLQFDPFTFSIAKGLIAYIVYALHFQLFGTFSNFTIATVNESVYGGYGGMLTSAGVTAAVSLYEAVLKK